MHESLADLVGEFEIRELRLVSPSEGGGCSLTLVLASSRSSPPLRYRVEFHGVRDLKLQGLGDKATIGGFAIWNISNRGWEGLCWQVRDYEDGVIGFFARSAQLVAVEMDTRAEPI
jgi:hypothetical protein